MSTSAPISGVLANGLTQPREAVHTHGGSVSGQPVPSLLRRLLAAESSDLWAVLTYSVVIGLIYLAVPVATQAVVNTIAFGTVVQPLAVLTAAVLLALGFSGALQIVRTWIVEIIQQRLFARITGAVASRLLSYDLRALVSHRGPELVNRFLEVTTLQKTTSVLLIDGLATASQILFAAVLLGLYHPWLLVLDVVLLLLIALTIIPFFRQGIRTSVAESKVKYDLVAWLEEMASHPELFRSTGRANYGLQRTGELLSSYIQRRRVHFRVLLTHISGFVAIHAICSAALLGVGGWLVIQRQLTLGQLIAAELVVNLMLNALTKFGKQLETYYDLEAAMDKLSHLVDLPLERDGQMAQDPSDLGMALRLSDVVLFDRETHRHVGPVSLQIPPGAKIAVRSFDSYAARALLDLLAARGEPASGNIYVDGYDLRQLNRARFRSEIALVRDIEIFDGSVLENLTFGDQAIPIGRVREQLEKLGVWETVSRLPEGLNTRLGAGQAELTKSQAVRLMLARALLSQPRLLLVDLSENLNALRGNLLNLLSEPSGAYTVIVCTDNDDLLRRCDRILTLTGEHAQTEVN